MLAGSSSKTKFKLGVKAGWQAAGRRKGVSNNLTGRASFSLGTSRLQVVPKTKGRPDVMPSLPLPVVL